MLYTFLLLSLAVNTGVIKLRRISIALVNLWILGLKFIGTSSSFISFILPPTRLTQRAVVPSRRDIYKSRLMLKIVSYY